MVKIVLSKQVRYLAVIIAILTALVVSASGFAQPTQAVIEDWRNPDYGFNSKMLDIDQDGNVYVLGDNPASVILVIKKFDAAGTLLWQTIYDPVDALSGVWIAVDSEGNAVVQGNLIRASTGVPQGLLTLKYDANGNLLWARSLPAMFSGSVRVEVDAENNIYVAGYAINDALLIKYSPSGATLWAATFDNGGAIDKASSMVISPDGTRIGVAGVSGLMFMALMYDSDGNRLWVKTDSNLYAANDVAFGPGNSSFFATGNYLSTDPNPYQMAIVKFDAAGNQSWVRSYPVGDRTFRIRLDSQNNIVAAGFDQNGYMDWMTIKTDPDGNLLWSRRYDGGRNNDEIVNMLVIDSADAVYVTGTGGPNPSSGTISYLKGVVAKYSSDGTPQWAVWDEYAGGKALHLGPNNTLTTLGFGYLVVTHYTETGLGDVIPAAPTNLTGSLYFTGVKYQVNLNFQDNANNEFWVVAERCLGSGCTDFAPVAQTRGENATGLADAALDRGVIYTYRVRAVGFMGVSDYTNTVQVTVPGVNPPAAPSNLTAAMSGANVVLNWQDNSNNETQFYIDRCQGAGCTDFMGWAGSGVPTWTDYSAAAGQSYSYRVRAWNVDGYSAYTNTVTINTSSVPSPTVYVPPTPTRTLTPTRTPTPLAASATPTRTPTLPAATATPGSTVPAAPSNLTASALSARQIVLSWTNNSANQSGVRIEGCQGPSCTNFAQFASAAGSTTSYTVAGLNPGTTYRFRVRAYNAAGNSPYSNIASARTKWR